MPQKIDPVTVLARRLKAARERKGLSQRQLGIAAGLDPFEAGDVYARWARGLLAT